MCSYCGCDSITVIGRFMGEHVAITNALTAMRGACHAGDPAAVEATTDEMVRLLHPHTVAEEVGLFTVMRRQEEFADHITGLCAEHRTLDALLEEIRGGANARFEAFQDALHVHLDREDNGLFPAAAIALSSADWEEVDASTPPPSSPLLRHSDTS